VQSHRAVSSLRGISSDPRAARPGYKASEVWHGLRRCERGRGG